MDKVEFIEWMEKRLEEKSSKVDLEDLSVMTSMLAKYKYNFKNLRDSIEYTAEEQRSLDAATIVYLLNM